MILKYEIYKIFLVKLNLITKKVDLDVKNIAETFRKRR